MSPFIEKAAGRVARDSRELPLRGVIARLKTRLQARYERLLPGQDERIRRALEKAESAAWRTPFPHLFLPDFAELRLAQLAESPCV
jgi:hypothetical protein